MCQSGGSGAGAGTGIGLLDLIAAFVSWFHWHSVGWPIVHGVLCGFYLLAWAFSCTASAPF